MFTNRETDPLAVPTAIERRSQGPTNRRTAGFVRVAAGGPPADHQWFGDPHATFSSEGNQGIGAGGGWEQGYDQMAEEELHRRHQERGGEGNADPREFYRPLARNAARVIEREAREFLAQDHGCDDRSELLYRAARHMERQTSTWTREGSQRATEAFCARVAQLIPKPQRMAAAPVTEFADFDDSLLY